MVAPSMTTASGAGFIGGDTVKGVFNTAALHAYRAMNVFRRNADIKWAGGPGAEPMPGSSITYTLISALAPATSTLAEATEPSAVDIADTQKPVTLAEYGNAVKHTKKLRLTSFLSLDLEVPREIGANMEESLDIVARDVLVAGTNVLYGGAATSRATVAATHTLAGNNLRRANAFLRGKNTPGLGGMKQYVGIGHPDVSYDLQVETGQQAWSFPHGNVDPAAIYEGEVGTFANIRWVENANSRNFVDAGVGSTVDVYATLIIGQQALGEAVAEAQHVVLSGPFDDLQRFVSVGWYALLGFGRIRENSLLRYETASSIGAN